MAQSDKEHTRKKYVFVCGLQRSGTSVLARNLGKLRDCASFRETGAIEDEGQYLQSVYPTNNELGGTGWYGFDPRAHLTEASDLLTPENVAKIGASWHAYWDKTQSIFLEKTPSNLLMTRFLQAAFPNSFFIVIKRHPVSVSMANQRWKKSMASLRMGFEHWLRCYGLFEEDKKHLTHLYQLNYEDYIKDAPKYHREIAVFLETRVVAGEMETVTDAHNKRYLDRWEQLLLESPFKNYYRYLAAKYEPRFAPFGYSLMTPNGSGAILAAAPNVSDGVGRLLCRGADFHAFLWRVATKGRGRARRAIKRIVPNPLKERVKRLTRKRG